MKKFLAVLFAVGLIFGLTACGGGDSSNNGNTGDNGSDNGNTGGNGSDNGNTSGTTVASAKTANIGDDVKVEGVISAIVYGASQAQVGCYITDATGTIYIFGNQFAPTVSKGDHVIIDGTAAVHNNIRQVSYPTLTTKVASGVEVSTSAAQEQTIGWIKNNITNLGVNTFKVKVTVSKNSYGSYELVGTDGEAFSCYSSGSNFSEFNYLDQYTTEITVVLAVQGTSGSGKPRGQIISIL